MGTDGHARGESPTPRRSSWHVALREARKKLIYPNTQTPRKEDRKQGVCTPLIILESGLRRLTTLFNPSSWSLLKERKSRLLYHLPCHFRYFFVRGVGVWGDWRGMKDGGEGNVKSFAKSWVLQRSDTRRRCCHRNVTSADDISATLCRGYKFGSSLSKTCHPCQTFVM